MRVGDIVERRGMGGTLHQWRVIGIHLGAAAPSGRPTESLVELESITHEPGWTGEFEYHPRLWVPEVLLQGAGWQPIGTAPQDRKVVLWDPGERGYGLQVGHSDGDGWLMPDTQTGGYGYASPVLWLPIELPPDYESTEQKPERA